MSTEATVREALEKMETLNRRNPCDIRSGAFCTSFDARCSSEPWVQAKTGALNIMYPFSEEPVALLRRTVAVWPDDAVCPDWEQGKYATFEFSPLTPVETAALINSIFLDLYGCEPDYTLSAQVFDTR